MFDTVKHEYNDKRDYKMVFVSKWSLCTGFFETMKRLLKRTKQKYGL